MIKSKLYLSTNNNTAYIVSQLENDIKAGKSPQQYHVVLNKAYLYTEQEMSPWKWQNLPAEKVSFNYYL